MKDYYAILEVPPTASQEAIREQYLFLIQAWHPDKFSTASQKAKAEEKCKQINIAYGVLKDAQKRAVYDRDLGGRPWRQGEGEGRRQTAEQRPRKQPEEARWRPAEEQQGEAADEQQVHIEYEAQARAAEEWIRFYFEQARRRKLGKLSVGLNQDAQDPIRVLVVADVADTRAQVGGLLSGQGDIRVVGEATDAVDAIRKFDALLPDVATVYTNLPTMNGISATEAIRRKYPIAKVIIIGIQGDTDYIRRAAMAGACDYLVKPPMGDDLVSAIRLAAGRGMPASERAATK